jgi:hypothetical protein
VFDETISETNDLTAEREGVDAAFDLGGDGVDKINKRLEQRRAALDGGGGAVVSSGQSGFGSARSR